MSHHIEILVHLTHTNYALYSILMLLYTIHVSNYTSLSYHIHILYTFHYTVNYTLLACDIIHLFAILFRITTLGKFQFCPPNFKLLLLCISQFSLNIESQYILAPSILNNLFLYLKIYFSHNSYPLYIPLFQFRIISVKPCYQYPNLLIDMYISKYP